MNKYYWKNNLATIGPLGYLPAPGTMGSLAAFLLCFIIKYSKVFNYNYIELIVISIIILISYFIIKISINNFNGNNDPKEIIIDEIAGCFIALYSVVKFSNLIYALIFFRFFDITKTLGISKIERKFTGPLGVLLDDLIAGVYANILVKILSYYGII